MLLKKIGLIALGLLVVWGVGTAFAQEATEEPATGYERWHWAEAGLSFDYPATWRFTREQQFQFVLFDPEASGDDSTFIGLQMGGIPADNTLQSLMAGVAGQFEGTTEDITFGGVEAVQIVLPASSGYSGRFIGYSPAEGEIALLNFQTSLANEAAFTVEIEKAIASAEVIPLEIDPLPLSKQLQAALAADQPLVVGEAEAPVTVVEVLDFSCGHCVEFSNSIDRLIQDYVVTGEAQLRLVHVTFVGGELSEIATHAQFCAIEQGVGWEMHELLIDNYKAAGGANFYSEENILSAVQAAELAVDAAALSTCMQERPYAQRIEEEAALAAEFGVNSTPSVLYSVNGEAPAFQLNPDSNEPLRGGYPLRFIYEYIDSLIAEAN